MWGLQLGTADDETLTVTGITLDNQNGIYAAGYTEAAGSFLFDGFLNRYTVDGKLAWSRAVVDSGDTLVYGVVADSQGNVFVTGNAGDADYAFIQKFSGRGVRLWTRRYDVLSFTNPQLDSAGNLYVLEGNFGLYDATVHKYSSSGQLIWKKSLGCVDNSPQPDESRGELQKAEIVTGELVKPREATSIVLELVKKAFNKVAFFVQLSVIITLLFAI